MRFLSTLLNDVRFQVKYGFYFLYAFFSSIYIAVLLVCPQEYKKIAAAIIILSDPAMLGSFLSVAYGCWKRVRVCIGIG